MADLKKLHNFAVKYYRLYVDAQTTELDVEEGFSEQCFALGFEMDCGERFVEVFSEAAFNSSEELNKIIDDINDVYLLGSAIFSQWRYVTHWSYCSHLLDDGIRPWFIAAFGRLSAITEETEMEDCIFEGTLRKIQLVSDIGGFFFRFPDDEDDDEQRLTITADGRVWLSRYQFGFGEHVLIEKSHFTIPPQAVKNIMDAFTDYFGNEHVITFACDCGTWNLVLTNTEGKSYTFTGSLYNDLMSLYGGLSDIIRINLNRNDLYVFDGNPDYVTKIEVKYHRITKSSNSTEEYSEHLTIDHSTETLEFVREKGTRRITNTYYVPYDISSFLENVDIYALSKIEGNPSDVIDDPSDIKEYTITLQTKHGNISGITGSFDKRGLPKDWGEFIESVYNFASSFGFGEIFDKQIYGKAKHRQSDYIFCNVTFGRGGRTYCYLADSDDYCVGDLAVVTAGEDNHEVVVKINSIEYYSENEVPFPVDNVKHILRKYEKDEK